MSWIVENGKGRKPYMDSSFEKNYAREQEIRRMHDAAQGSREGMADAVDAYQFFRNSIMTEAFRRHGIEKFTYSSGWSGAAKAAWQFIQHGCILEGMLEIYGPHMKIGSDKHEKVYGYVFSVRQEL